jgi:hypothetical protein
MAAGHAREPMTPPDQTEATHFACKRGVVRRDLKPLRR